VISRAFSIAITACAAKLCRSAICLSLNGWTSERGDHAKERFVLTEGHRKQRADSGEIDDPPKLWRHVLEEVFGWEVGDVDDLLALN
jgi:hypothetical protein